MTRTKAQTLFAGVLGVCLPVTVHCGGDCSCGDRDRPDGDRAGASAAGSGAAPGDDAGRSEGGSAGTASPVAGQSGATTGGSSQAGGAGDLAGSGQGGHAPACSTVSGDYGDCEAVLGWGFDGDRCRLFGGCDCAPDCDKLYGTALACATACRSTGYCREATFESGGLAGPLKEGKLCDDLTVCTGTASEAELGALLELSVCEPNAECPDATMCRVVHSGTVSAAEWGSLCTASVLPVDSITCMVYGP
jgi:hypothetical protein